MLSKTFKLESWQLRRRSLTFQLSNRLKFVFASQITAQSIEADLYTSPNALRGWHLPEPDILIRTSGVSRLSDFLLWQVSPVLYLLGFTSLY